MSFILGIIPSFFVILTKIFVIFAKNSPPTPKKTQSRCPPTIAAVRKIGGKISPVQIILCIQNDRSFFLAILCKNLASRAESPPTGGGEEAQRRARAGAAGGFSVGRRLGFEWRGGGKAQRHGGLARRSCVTGGIAARVAHPACATRLWRLCTGDARRGVYAAPDRKDHGYILLYGKEVFLRIGALRAEETRDF